MALTARATRATMVGTRVAKPRGGAFLHKTDRSPDRSLQLDVKSESPSNRESECHGEYVPGPCTPPVTPWEWVAPEVASLTARDGYHGVIHDWGEVVTR